MSADVHRKFYTQNHIYIMWLCIALFYPYQFFVRAAPSALTDEFMRTFATDAKGVGWLASLYYLVYAPMQIPVGYLLDKYGPRRLASAAAIICALSLMVFVSTTSFPIAAISRLLFGFGAAFAFVSSVKMITTWFSPTMAPVMTGLTVTLGTILGGMGASTTLPLLSNALGWQGALWLVALVGIVIAINILVFVKDRNPMAEYNKETSSANTLGVVESLKIIISERQFWLLGIYSAFMYAPISAFADLWGGNFLRAEYAYELTKANFASTMIFLGMAVGSPLFGLYSNMIESRRIPIIVGAFGTTLFFSLAIYMHFDSYWVIMGMLFLTGVFTCGQLLTFSVGCESAPKYLNATITGFLNMLCMLSGSILQPLLGWVADQLWDGVVENGVPVYSAACYRTGLSIVIACLVGAIILSFFIRETYPKTKRSGA